MISREAGLFGLFSLYLFIYFLAVKFSKSFKFSCLWKIILAFNHKKTIKWKIGSLWESSAISQELEIFPCLSTILWTNAIKTEGITSSDNKLSSSSGNMCFPNKKKKVMSWWVNCESSLKKSDQHYLPLLSFFLFFSSSCLLLSIYTDSQINS